VHRGIDKRGIVAPFVLPVSIKLLSLWNLPRRSLELSSLVKKFAVDPVCILSCCCDTCRSILFLTVGFMGLRCVVPLSVQ